jgi:hypothetical protein
MIKRSKNRRDKIREKKINFEKFDKIYNYCQHENEICDKNCECYKIKACNKYCICFKKNKGKVCML